MQQAGLCLWASLHSRPAQPSSEPLSLALPPLQPLLCSPAALQPCHHVVLRALGGTLFIESTAVYCPQVCSELLSHGQGRILATGTLILSTEGDPGICVLTNSPGNWETPLNLRSTDLAHSLNCFIEVSCFSN